MKWFLVSAAVLVLFVAIVRLAVRDTIEEDADSFVVDAGESGASAFTFSDQEPQREADESNVARDETAIGPNDPLEPSASNTEAKRLFSTPSYSTDEYRAANDLASAFLAEYTAWSRNMIVKTDVETIKELMRQVESNPDGLEASFDVSPYSDVPCVLSSVRNTSQRFTPGFGEAPTRYSVDGPCESSSTLVTITFLRDENSFKVSLVSPVWGAYSVRSLGDWQYSLAIREDAFVPLNREAPPPR